MRVEGFYTSCPPSFEPLTHRSFAHSQGDRNIFLSPSGFFQFPGAFAPFFSPIGFLWCSHASYSSTLYLLPPRSVSRRSLVCRPHREKEAIELTADIAVGHLQPGNRICQLLV